MCTKYLRFLQVTFRGKMKKYYGIIVVTILIIAQLFVLLPVGVVAAEQDNSSHAVAVNNTGRTVRVGWPLQGEMSNIDSDGNIRGYAYEYLMRMKQFANWQYEFVVYQTDNDSLNSMFDDMTNGDLDILINMRWIEVVEEAYNCKYATMPYGYTNTLLVANQQNDSISNLYELIINPNLKIGTYGKLTTEKLLQFCAKSGIAEDRVVVYDSQDALKAAFVAGDITVKTESDILAEANDRKIAKFNYEEVYFCVSNDKADLLHELNSISAQIESTSPTFQIELYNKYFTSSENEGLLTASEKAYIQNLDDIDVYVPSNAAPIQYVDDDGNLCGITIDILNLISERTNITFNIIEVKAKDILSIDIHATNVLFASLPYDYGYSASNKTLLTSPYLSVPVQLYCNQYSIGKQYSESTVGATIKSFYNSIDKDRGVTTSKDILHQFKEQVEFDNYADMLRALNEGKIDYAYGNSYSMSNLFGSRNYDRVVMVPVVADPIEYCIGLYEKADAQLYTIINKVVSSLSYNEISAIVVENSSKNVLDISFGAFLSAHITEFFIILLSVFFVIIALIVTIFLIRIRTNRRLIFDARRYTALSELSGDHIVEYFPMLDQMMLTKHCAELFGVPRVIKEYTAKYIETGTFVINDIVGNYAERQLVVADGSKRWFGILVSSVADDKGIASILYKITDIHDSIQERDKLYQMAINDDLTGLNKIGHFKEQVSEYLNSNAPHESALLMFDLDDFKSINDNYGHFEGDQALIKVADSMRRVIGNKGILCRMGGDEFLAFLYSADKNTARKIARKVVSTYQQSVNLGEVYTISYGVAVFNGYIEYDEAYKIADADMYNNKSNKKK